jgi:hypothetical protein
MKRSLNYVFLWSSFMTLLVTSANALGAATGPAPQRALFVGASLTSRLPALTAFSIAQTGMRLQAERRTFGGTGLQRHLDLGLVDFFQQHDYDIIVLTSPRARPGRPDQSEALSQAVQAARRSGATVVLYERPVTQAAYEDYPETIAASRARQLDYLREHQVIPMPVDQAFALALADLPFETLFVEDRVHFTDAGWYLAMCVSHAVLRGRSPVGLPPFVTHNDDVTMTLAPELAARLQAWAWQAVQEANQVAEAENRPQAGKVLSSRHRRPRLQVRSPGSEWAAYASGAAVPVIARVHSIAAPLVRVEVLIDGDVVEALTQPPYRTLWQPPQDGTYQLRLRATDRDGRQARTDAVTLMVGELPPEPSRTAPTLTGLQWRELPIGAAIEVRLRGAKHEPAFASWRLMQGDVEVARCPDTAMRLQWTPSAAGLMDLHARARTDDGTEYRSESVLLVYDPPDRPAGPFLGQAMTIPGVLQLERFDHGGDGVGWSGGRRAKGPRADSGMMLFPLAERDWIVWAKSGNRWVYTVDVTAAGRYRPVLDAANRGREQGAKRIHLTCRATEQTVRFAVTATGSNTD